VFCTPTWIVKDTFVDASTIDDDGVSAAHAGPNNTTQSMTIGGALATGGVATLTPARAVIVTVTHASAVVAESGTITGTDIHGRAITETWSVTAGTTSKTYTSAQAFKTVTAITETAASDASANTCKVGDSKRLGLSFKASSVKVIAEEEDGAIPTLGVIVKASSTANTDLRGTYTPNSTLNGALDFSVWYLSDDLGAII
jgi:hypothetical protein